MSEEKKIQHEVAQTYAEDMAKVLESDKEGLIKKVIHGEEQHEAEKRGLSPRSTKNKVFMSVGLLLVGMSVATLIYLFLNHKSISTVEVAKQFTPLIFQDKSSFFEVKGFKKDQITETVRGAVNKTEVKIGGVEGMYLTSDKVVVGWREFVKLIKSTFERKPDISGKVDFVNDNFLLGVVNGESKDFFILLKVRSVIDVFESMRAWEGKMFTDLHGFFGMEISSNTSGLLGKSFEDGIVENKNARILYTTDAEGKNQIVMMYVFADDNSVIITNTISAAHEVMLRLNSSQVEK
jgi:hypothetical protein